MIFVEAIPVLHEDARRQVIDVFFHVHALGEKAPRVRRAGEFLAKQLQIAQPLGFPGFSFVVVAVRGFAAEIAFVRLVGPGLGFE